MGSLKKFVGELFVNGVLYFNFARNYIRYNYLVNEETRKRNAENKQVEQKQRTQNHDVIRNFLKSHDQLDPNLYLIPMQCYNLEAFSCAVEAVNMLMDQHANLVLNDWQTTYILMADGTVCDERGDMLWPSASTKLEISRFIADSWTPDKKSWNLLKNLQRQAEFMEKTGPHDAACFLTWMQAALQVQPRLLRYYRMIRAFDEGVWLERVAVEEEPEDTLESWRV